MHGHSSVLGHGEVGEYSAHGPRTPVSGVADGMHTDRVGDYCHLWKLPQDRWKRAVLCRCSPDDGNHIKFSNRLRWLISNSNPKRRVALNHHNPVHGPIPIPACPTIILPSSIITSSRCFITKNADFSEGSQKSWHCWEVVARRENTLWGQE